jgi:hypothetical protein
MFRAIGLAVWCHRLWEAHAASARMRFFQWEIDESDEAGERGEFDYGNESIED